MTTLSRRGLKSLEITMKKSSKGFYHIEKFFSLSPDLLCIANIAGYFERVNPAFTQILGYSIHELLSKPFVNFIYTEDVDNTKVELDKLSQGVDTIHFENRFLCKNGTYRWFSWKAYYETETGLLYAIARDITEKKELETKLLELSRLDHLTGVLNRRAFTELCLTELKMAARHHHSMSLVIIDVDFFKEFNDNKGHIQGDKVLRKISHVLRKQLRRSADFISRYGGDEFLVLLSHTNLEQAMDIAEHLRKSIEVLKIPYKTVNTDEFLTITLGVTTILPHKNYSVNQIISVADLALYKAKNAGRNQVVGSDFVE